MCMGGGGGGRRGKTKTNKKQFELKERTSHGYRKKDNCQTEFQQLSYEERCQKKVGFEIAFERRKGCTVSEYSSLFQMQEKLETMLFPVHFKYPCIKRRSMGADGV